MLAMLIVIDTSHCLKNSRGSWAFGPFYQVRSETAIYILVIQKPSSWFSIIMGTGIEEWMRQTRSRLSQDVPSLWDIGA